MMPPMTYPPQPPYGDDYPEQNPYGAYGAQPGYGPQPGYAQPQPGYSQSGYQQPGYQQPGFQQPGYQQPGFAQPMPMYGAYSADPSAPFGRDPMTGEPLSDKSKLTAGLLQLFLGGFGVGRFYLGHTGIACAQLALTIVGWLTVWLIVGILPLMAVAIWALIDAIMIFTGSVRDSRGLLLRS